MEIVYYQNNYIIYQDSMNTSHAFSQCCEEQFAPVAPKDIAETSVFLKAEEQTASKEKQCKVDENRDSKIRNFIFSLFKHQSLRGNIKVENFDSLEVIELILFHKISQYSIQETLRLTFAKSYPATPPTILIHSCNLTQKKSEYNIPNFLALSDNLSNERWSEEVALVDVIANIYENIHNFHQSEVKRLLCPKESAQIESDNQLSDFKEEEDRSLQRRRQKRKNSSMTGCADKELTQTKNLNRHFRSKLREVLRDLAPDIQDQHEDYKFIDELFTPNRVGFQDIRKALSNRWFNLGVRKQMSTGQFLHKILRGMMGIKSKKLMIKYYHVMVSAVQEPNSFIRWKYD